MTIDDIKAMTQEQIMALSPEESRAAMKLWVQYQRRQAANGQHKKKGRGRAKATLDLIDAIVKIAAVIQPCSVPHYCLSALQPALDREHGEEECQPGLQSVRDRARRRHPAMEMDYRRDPE